MDFATAMHVLLLKNMADSGAQCCAFSHILPENSGITSEYVCNKCSAYEAHLKEALAELGLAQLIINILQKELITSASTMNTRDENIASMEEFVNFNPRRKKKNSSMCGNDNLLISQQFQHIPVIVSRYAPLDNLQAATKASHSRNEIGEVASITNSKAKKFLPSTKKKKIVIIGDSHAKGYASETTNNLDNNFEIIGSVMPGARLENITKLANGEISS